MQTINISGAALSEALQIAGGLYRMNATTACGYAFSVAADRDSVGSGEFVWRSELPGVLDGYCGYIDFNEHSVLDIESGEKLNIKGVVSTR